MILWFWLTFALAGPTTVAAESVDEHRARALLHGRRLALVVGPAQFQPDFAPLQYTDDDARALAEVLADPSQGRFDQVWTLTLAKDTTLQATRDAMAAVSAASTSADDTVVVYFSTHGTLDGISPNFEQFLVLSDTSLKDVSHTALAHNEVLRWLDALPSRRKVLVLATCHSGQGKSAFSQGIRSITDHTKGAIVPPLAQVSEATVVIGVCAFNETARESEQLGHDIYTAFFLDALRDGDTNGDGAVTITEAHALARDQTWTFTEGAQRAYARAEIVGEDPIVLTGERVRGGRPSLGSYLLDYVGYTVFVDGQEKGALPGEIVLEAGKHLIEVQAPGDGAMVARQHVRLATDDRLGLDRLMRSDRLRLAVGGGMALYGSPLSSAPTGRSELHLPRLLGRGWETVLSGSASVRWPRPTLDGAVTFERAITPGPLEFRLGGALHGYLLGASLPTPILAPSVVPEPVLSLVFLPEQPIVARLAVGGGYLWFADRGIWNSSWTGGASLVVGTAY